MALIIVNPTKQKPRVGPSAHKKKGVPMATKKRRTAAQKAAFLRMLAGRKRHRNPSHRKSYRRHHAPARRVYTRRRNPSSGGGSLVSELLSKDGLMMTAAIVGTPTLTELAVAYIMPTASGTTRSLVKAGLGLGIAYAVHRFVSKKAGLVVGLVSVGTAVSDLINAYTSTSSLAAPAVTKGYLPRARGNSMGRLKGYSEPGVVVV